MMRPRGFTLIEVVTVMGIFALLAGIVISNMQRGKQSQILREASQVLVDNIRLVQNKTSVGTSLNICKRNEDVDSEDFPSIYEGACSTIGEACSDRYTCARVFPKGGYGIFFDRENLSTYTLYADFGAIEKRNNANGVPVLYEGVGNTDSLVQEVVLPQDVHIASVWITPQFAQSAGLLYSWSGVEYGTTTCYVPSDGNIAPLQAPINSDLSIAWIPPNAKMYAVAIADSLHGICPDYVINILLKHAKANTCRLVTINGASGLVDEKSDSSCTIPE